MRRLVIFKLSWSRAVCALALGGLTGIALTVLAGSEMSRGDLVASSGGMTMVEEGNGKARAAAERDTSKRPLRNTPRTKRSMTFHIAIGSNLPPVGNPMVKVDGIFLQAANGNPQIFAWEDGELHHIEPSPSLIQCGPGCQWIFTSWSDGTTNPFKVIPVDQNTPTSFIANFELQYFLTMNVNPAGKGTAFPSNGWRKKGTPVTITAAAVAPYVFGSWTGTGQGSYQGTIKERVITMNDPITETANLLVQMTITSNPTGAVYVIVNGNNVSTPQTYNWVPNSTQTVTAVSPVTCGTGCRYVFNSWSDGNTSPSRQITVSGAPATYTAIYQKQFLLTMKVSAPVGSVKPGTSWHNSGATVPITASGKLSPPRYDFFSWTGLGSKSYSGTPKPPNSARVIMNGPITETANFKPNPGKADSPTGGPKPN